MTAGSHSTPFPSTAGGTIPIRLEFKNESEKESLPPLLTSNTKPLPFYTSWNTSMSQQGLTASVSCQTRELNLESDPPLLRSFEPANLTLYNQSYTLFQVGTMCLGEPSYSGELIRVCGNRH
jgi:hypothetical protein